MIPNPAEVVRRRWTVVAVVRLLAALMCLWGVVPLALWLVEGISDGDLWEVSYYGGQIALSAMLLLPGLVGVLASGLIARLVVPARTRVDCPRCRYALEGLTEARCPECGLPLPREFMGEERAPAAPEPRAVRLIKLRDTLTPIVRLLGMLLAFFYFFIAVSLTLVVFLEPGDAGLPQQIVWLMHAWLGLVLGLWLIARGRSVASMIVPKARPDGDPTP